MAQILARSFTRLSALSTIVLLIPFISSAQTAPLDLTLEAEAMTKTTGSGWGTYWGLWSEGSVSANVTFTTTAIHQFTVTAYGTSAAGVSPNLALKIDDVIVAQTAVTSTTPAAYAFSVNVEKGAHKVSLAYTNDANVNGQDRNLILDKVRILQTATTAPSTFPEAPATIEAEKMEIKSVGAVSGIYWMLWSNGKVENRVSFKTSGSYDIKVIAKGTLADSKGPNMDILLDGAKVASQTNVGTSNATYSFKLNISAGTHALGVAFTNDAIINGSDRNLYVDKVSVAASTSGTTPSPTPSPTPTPIPATPTPTPAPGGTPGLKYIGRFDFSDPAGPRFTWPGTAIEARFSGTSVSARLTTSQDTYFTVLVDQKAPVTMKATAGTRAYVLASGLASGTHTVRLVRNNESEQGPTQFLGFTFSSGGQLLAPDATRKLRMEVVGDSISAGYGSIGVGPNCPFEPATSSNFAAYGSVAGRALNADVTTIAISGIGAYHNYGGAPNDPNNPPITTHYPLTMFSWSGAYKNMLYDFSSQQPKDIVVINIGTNDFSNGVHDSAGFTSAYTSLVKLVRSKNPTAHIFLVVGSLISGAELNQWRSNVQTVMSNLQAAGDGKLHFVEFPAQDGSRGFGCDYHPSAAQHEYMAGILVNAIKPYATLP